MFGIGNWGTPRFYSGVESAVPLAGRLASQIDHHAGRNAPFTRLFAVADSIIVNMNRILPASKVVPLIGATRAEYAAFRMIRPRKILLLPRSIPASPTHSRALCFAVGVFAAPIGIWALWALDPPVRHHLAPEIFSDPDAEAQ